MIFLPSVRQMPREHTGSDASSLGNRSGSANSAEVTLLTTRPVMPVMPVMTWEVCILFALLVLTPVLCGTSLVVGVWSGLDATQLVISILGVLAACGFTFAVVLVRYLYRFRSRDTEP